MRYPIHYAPYDLTELPSPAAHYMTTDMALASLRNRGIAWPVSGDHTTKVRLQGQSVPLIDYIDLARSKNV